MKSGRRSFFRKGLFATVGLSIFDIHKSFASDPQLPEGFIIEDERLTEIKGKYDVVVCGAGPAGVCAAIKAGRLGAKVLLVEANGCLGGVWTAGLLSWILDWQNKTGLIQEITSELIKRGATSDYYEGKSFPFDVEEMKVLLEEMCLKTNNIQILLHTRLVDVIQTDKKLSHIVTESKSGREAWEGKMFIDCTGDGDLAAFSGCEFDFGENKTGLTQPFTLLAMISGVTYESIKPFVRKVNDQGSKMLVLKEMRKAGMEPSINQPGIFPIREDLFMVMFNHEYEKSALNTVDVTNATIHARAEIMKLVKGLKSLGKPWEDVYVVATAEHIGVREGRRIKGQYTVTENDLIIGKKHDDNVCTVTFPVDVHSLTEEESNSGKEYGRGIKSKPYDIPIRALISKDKENLLMAGRNISGDFIAFSSYRVTGNAVAMGEAAGEYAVGRL
ncbi:FAD-dependent oxidoreductase [Arenibacter sp. F26102]|uniref:FAD-dependent oxidoreductase n=1 Tax=Arenibacter sp. F26102 TaxID=2926416 RepID=UPI001FF1C4BA|nr:FAD-dependent oxidoreductase [Arenibacter sp. F26102]MCK0146014.1 FAD-dependent oxidoreductase [Arenibacter sp. F26102]